MPRVSLGPFAADVLLERPIGARWLEGRLPGFVLDDAPDPTQVRVRVRQMGAGYDPALHQDARVIQAWPSLRLLHRDTRAFAVLTGADQQQAIAVAVSDHRFTDNLLWLDPALLQRGGAADALTSCLFVCVFYPFFMHAVAGQGRGLLLHTAMVRIDGRMWLFAGRSGIGKSTFSRLWLGHDSARILNDDRALLCPAEQGTGIRAYSTPWMGDDRIMLNAHGPLAGLCFLHQGVVSATRPLSPQQALPQLLRVSAIPWHAQGDIGPALDVCNRLLTDVPAYELHFRPDQSAVDAVLELARR